jgi:uncharacterized damage-inducible protein DinB
MKIAARTIVLLASFALLGLAGTVCAQEGAAQKQHTPSEAVLANWNDIGGKLVAMAQDWPEDKYAYHPNADVRTFQQVLLHIAGSNYGLINGMSGKKVGDEKNDPAVADYKTKAQTVEFLKKSIADGAAEIKREGDAGVLKSVGDWIGYIEHMGEHYGLLVAYYRVNGVVPPESRPKK